MSEQAQILVIGVTMSTLLHSDSVLRRRAAVANVVNSGAEAMIALRERPARLALFDFDLGDMTAPLFCREVRGDDRARGTSLLFVGERKSEEHADLCLAAGCNDYVLRPIVPHEIDAKIERLLSIPVRRTLRTLTRVEVSVERAGRFLLGHSINISSSGMLLELDHVLPPAANVHLQFYLHGDAKAVRVGASVTRADYSGAFPTYGCRFDPADDDAIARVRRYVERIRAREAL